MYHFGHCMLCYLICEWFGDDFDTVDEDCYTIATVGDDNAVVVTLCRLVCLDSSSPILTVEHQFSEPSAHSSSITGTLSRRSYTVYSLYHVPIVLPICHWDTTWSIHYNRWAYTCECICSVFFQFRKSVTSHEIVLLHILSFVPLLTTFSFFSGVKFLRPDTLVTTSVDQRINVWQLVGSSSEKPLRLVSSHFHDVTDTAALQLYHTK